jgi:hypothetical protein
VQGSVELSVAAAAEPVPWVRSRHRADVHELIARSTTANTRR